MREARAAMDALSGVGTLFGQQDSLVAFEEARQRWMAENHEAVFAGELGLDPTEESAQAASALAAARDAALAAVRAAMATGKTNQQQAQLGYSTLSSLLSANPWLANAFPELGNLLGTLGNQAGSAGAGGTVPGAFTGTGGIKGAIGSALGYSTVIINTGADPTAVATALSSYNGGATSGGMR
jgi:hypothetical protein